MLWVMTTFFCLCLSLSFCFIHNGLIWPASLMFRMWLLFTSVCISVLCDLSSMHINCWFCLTSFIFGYVVIYLVCAMLLCCLTLDWWLMAVDYRLMLDHQLICKALGLCFRMDHTSPPRKLWPFTPPWCTGWRAGVSPLSPSHLCPTSTTPSC